MFDVIKTRERLFLLWMWLLTHVMSR